MKKNVFIIISILLVASYLIVAVTQFNLQPNDFRCKKVEVIIKDTSDVNLITKSGVVEMLKSRGIQLIGKRMNEIDTRHLEKEACRYPLVRNVECYKTLGGKICFEVSQRIPILHIMNQYGDDYYIDNIGQIIPALPSAIAYRPIVTGCADKWYTTNFLYKLGVYIYYNNFWRAAIQQINILPGRNIELIPRIGNHIIYLGGINHYDEKLNRLFVFYQQGLSKVGWNKYSRISLEFNNQIICTKRADVMAADSIK
ncbi:MAG: cell division protein FtsQ [Bacteroidales bacterium]|nr:cell division protein FtsQ [Bacteroidales bacterium]